MIAAAFLPSDVVKTGRAKYEDLPLTLAGSSGAGRFVVYPDPPSIAIHLRNTPAAGLFLLYGFRASDQEPVGVTGFPPSNIGWAATPQSTFAFDNRGSSHGPSTMYAIFPAANSASFCSVGTPRGEVPSANCLPYHSKAFTHCGVVTSGLSGSFDAAPLPPPRDMGSGWSW